jgi:parallel beta-helix repeat protein
MKVASIIVVLLVLSFVLTSSEMNIVKAEPKTIIVPDNYPTIQEAIDASSEGDTVLVKEGTYYENLDIEKSLSLVGEDRDTTIIDGGYIDSVFNISQDRVNISGFTLRNTGSGTGVTSAAIYLDGAKYCNISRNRITNSPNGIFFVDSSYNTIEENKIENNFQGISMIYSFNNTISKNNIAQNDQDIFLTDTHTNNFIGNNITNSESGVTFSFANYNTFSLNNFINNTKQINDSHYSQEGQVIWVSINFWDNGTVGNYWSNYPGEDSDGDGIGDTSYIIDEYNKDNFPMMNVITESPMSDNKTTQNEEPFPTIWIIAAILITAVGVAVLIYYTKLKKTKNTPREPANLHNQGSTLLTKVKSQCCLV